MRRMDAIALKNSPDRAQPEIRQPDEIAGDILERRAGSTKNDAITIGFLPVGLRGLPDMRVCGRTSVMFYGLMGTS